MEELVYLYQETHEELTFAEIYEEVKPYSMNYLRKFVNTKHLAFQDADLEEIFHDGLSKAVNSFPKGTFRGYLTTCLHNTACNELRRGHRKYNMCFEGGNDVFTNRSSNNYTMDDNILGDEYPMALIEKYLYMLSEDDQKFYIDLRVHGYTLAEMSVRYNCSIQNIRTREKNLTNTIRKTIISELD